MTDYQIIIDAEVAKSYVIEANDLHTAFAKAKDIATDELEASGLVVNDIEARE